MPTTTLVFGASTNPARASYQAVRQLRQQNIPVVAIGLKTGTVADVEIQMGHPMLADVDTITLYLGPDKQPEHYDYFLGLRPRRIIFNPGTENPELYQLARQEGILPEIACTLVLLSLGQY